MVSQRNCIVPGLKRSKAWPGVQGEARGCEVVRGWRNETTSTAWPGPGQGAMEVSACLAVVEGAGSKPE
jgi:hypothetical protein